VGEGCHLSKRGLKKKMIEIKIEERPFLNVGKFSPCRGGKKKKKTFTEKIWWDLLHAFF